MVVSRDGAGAPSGGGAGSADDSGGSSDAGAAGPDDADSAGGGFDGGGDSDLGGTAPSSDDDDDPYRSISRRRDGALNDDPEPASTTVDGVGSVTRDRDGDPLAGSNTVDVSVGVGSGPSPPEFDALDRDSLQRAGETFTESVAEPAGNFIAATSPVAGAEQAFLGTDRTGRLAQGAGEGAAQLANVPGNAAGVLDTAETIDDAASRARDPVTVGGIPTGVSVPDPEGQAANTRRAGAAGAAAANAAAENPFETTGQLIGGAVAGSVASRAITSRVDTAPRPDTGDSSPLGDLSAGIDFEDFRSDTRAQTGGRQRTDTAEQETVTIERDAGDVSQADRTLGETPGVDVERPDGVDLETQIRQIADEPAGRQRTPRQRAESRVPGERAFESPAARQREIGRLEDRFRREDMSDLDGRVVPRQTPGVDETTAGRFGLTDLGGAALGGSATTTQGLDSPFGTGAEAEPEVTTGTASGILGGVAGPAAADSAGGGFADGVADTDTVTGTATETGTDIGTSTVAEPIEELRASTVVEGAQRTDAASRQATQPATLAEPDTATDLQTTGFGGGLGFAGPGRPETRRPRGERDDEDEDAPPLFALDADAETFGSGIASGSEQLEEFGLGSGRL